MKKIFTFMGIIALFATMSCSQTSQKSSPKNSNATIEFENIEHDFGTIPYKGDGSFEFKFKNTGKTPLVLSNVRSSCGCTVPEWPKDPINKGDKGIVKVSYNTRISGSFSKTISVFSNATDKPVILKITGKVEEAPEDQTIAKEAPAGISDDKK